MTQILSKRLMNLRRAHDDGRPVGVVAPGAGADPRRAAPAAEEEKTEFTVKLEGFDAAQKIKVIKEVRPGRPELGLKEAKELVEGRAAVLKKGLKKERRRGCQGEDRKGGRPRVGVKRRARADGARRFRERREITDRERRRFRPSFQPPPANAPPPSRRLLRLRSRTQRVLRLRAIRLRAAILALGRSTPEQRPRRRHRFHRRHRFPDGIGGSSRGRMASSSGVPEKTDRRFVWQSRPTDVPRRKVTPRPQPCRPFLRRRGDFRPAVWREFQPVRSTVLRRALSPSSDATTSASTRPRPTKCPPTIRAVATAGDAGSLRIAAERSFTRSFTHVPNLVSSLERWRCRRVPVPVPVRLWVLRVSRRARRTPRRDACVGNTIAISPRCRPWRSRLSPRLPQRSRRRSPPPSPRRRVDLRRASLSAAPFRWPSAASSATNARNATAAASAPCEPSASAATAAVAAEKIPSPSARRTSAPIVLS